MEYENEGGFFYKVKNFNLEEFFYKYRFQLVLVLIGVSFLGIGAFYFKDSFFESEPEVQILGESESQNVDSKIVVEIVGAVENPGVYEFESGARVNDLLIAAGGVSEDADREWMEKMLNRAARLADGQKIYIPNVNEQLDASSANSNGGDQSVSTTFGTPGSNLVNINTASAGELEELWGIGPVFAQSIIEQRPYSFVEELSEKKIIRSDVYERNKDLMTVY